MRKILLLVSLVITSGIYFKTQAQINSNGVKNNSVGEKIFLEHADECLALIEQAAQKISIKGVTIVAFIPGDSVKSWISKMKVVGALSNNRSNFLAIANSKAAEMADTYTDSGSGIREPKQGEFGYQGGVIKKVKYGYILAVFSGGKSEEDAAVSKEGLDLLYKYYLKGR